MLKQTEPAKLPLMEMFLRLLRSVVATKAEDAIYNSVSGTPVVITIEKIKVTDPSADTTVYSYNGKKQTYKLDKNDAYTITGDKQTNANEINQ